MLVAAGWEQTDGQTTDRTDDRTAAQTSQCADRRVVVVARCRSL